MAQYVFPKDFLWAAATASYQIEGAYDEDGKGESIWDQFSHTPGNIEGGDTGDVACDHYHRYRDDVRLMSEIGLQAYRFSTSWPRIFPQGGGRPNQKGMDFYQRLADELLSYGIEPVVTLYHWDLPQALQDNGGWPNRDTARYYADYAAFVFEKLADRVKLWITHNEPWVVAMLGYWHGVHAPGIKNPQLALQAAHHILLSHGLAVQAFRDTIGPPESPARIGITLNMAPVHPATGNVEDLQAARRLDGHLNRWFIDPVVAGRYPDDIWNLYEQHFDLTFAKDGDLATIAAGIDFLGVNYYTRNVVKAGGENLLGVEDVPPSSDITDMGWEVYPEGIYELLTRIQREYGVPQIYITENGAAYPDVVKEGRVEDPRRIEYIRSHLIEIHRAIQSGVPVKGYFLWSLLDNFEWAFGYSKRFGIVYVDYETQERILKDSALWYKEVIAANGV